jgi:hypothetical protein
VKNTPLSQDLPPDQSGHAAAAPSEGIGTAEEPPPLLLPVPRAECQPPMRAVFVAMAASVLVVNLSAGLSGAEGSKAQAAVAPATQLRIIPSDSASVEISKSIARRVEPASLLQYSAQAEGITIEAEMPSDVSGSLNTTVIFVFEATSDGEWKEQPVADIVIGDTITYLPPPGTRTLGFVAGEVTAAIDLKPGFAGRICLEVDTSSRSDFLWALGYRRSTTITGIRPALTDHATCSAYFASDDRTSGLASRIHAYLDPAA